ncbi:hypothetical protein [Prochlorococcus marinus]|uniref:hypothetical protein n=1 Tax=Prochlorococcus marinus TaxID=1219 RepID=UPI0022B312CD|nr:hypothetical protein [Prochlorococcus marinus]
MIPAVAVGLLLNANINRKPKVSIGQYRDEAYAIDKCKQEKENIMSQYKLKNNIRNYQLECEITASPYSKNKITLMESYKERVKKYKKPLIEDTLLKSIYSGLSKDITSLEEFCSNEYNNQALIEINAFISNKKSILARYERWYSNLDEESKKKRANLLYDSRLKFLKEVLPVREVNAFKHCKYDKRLSDNREIINNVDNDSFVDCENDRDRLTRKIDVEDEQIQYERYSCYHPALNKKYISLTREYRWREKSYDEYNNRLKNIAYNHVGSCRKFRDEKTLIPVSQQFLDSNCNYKHIREFTKAWVWRSSVEKNWNPYEKYFDVDRALNQPIPEELFNVQIELIKTIRRIKKYYVF